jgi:hypothetical protein
VLPEAITTPTGHSRRMSDQPTVDGLNTPKRVMNNEAGAVLY